MPRARRAVVDAACRARVRLVRFLYTDNGGIIRIPEIFWLAARWGRWGLGTVLDEMIGLGALGATEAVEIARDVLGRNAARVYGLAA